MDELSSMYFHEQALQTFLWISFLELQQELFNEILEETSKKFWKNI